MTKVIIDAGLRARLNGLDDLLELCDESGHTLGYFHPAALGAGSRSADIRSPFTEEEVERRRQQRTGRPLSEILEDLNKS